MRQRGAHARPKRPKTKSSSEPELHELHVIVRATLSDVASAALIEAGAGGVVEERAGLRVRLVVYGSRRELGMLERSVRRALGDVETRIAPLAPSLGNWETAWLDDLEPVRISPTLVLAPARGEERETVGSARARTVRLEPAVAFGFGEHPTTRLAARAVEHACRRGGVRSVLDFGSGSGVLAIVAVVTGAREAVGLDVDPRAVQAAKRNAMLNRVEGRCQFSKARLSSLRSRFDLVVANIDRGTLLEHASRLAHAVGPGGTLLTTGFLKEDVPDLVRAFTAHGLRRSAATYDGEWALLTFSARALRAPRATRATARRTTRKPKNR